VIPRRWATALLGTLGVALLPWTLWLGLSLPSQKVAENWDLAWAGFDLVLAASVLGTALALVRRSPRLPSLAAASGALLVADAWFDITTASSGQELWPAIGLAAIGELPISALCFVLAARGPAG
jgi:hypothetical protein